MNTDFVRNAAVWLLEQPAGNPRIVSDLKKEFSLSAKQACEAIAQATAIRAERAKP